MAFLQKRIDELPLYPITYLGITYTEETVDEKFDAFYHTLESVRCDGGIYAFDGMVIYPDGSIIDERED